MMKISRLYLLSTLLIFLFCTGFTRAGMKCQTDSFGNKNCRDSNGKTWFGRPDLSGNVLWTDNQGNTIREEKNSFGNTTYRNNSGVLRGRKDSFGNESWRDNNGNTINGITDSFGNTSYRGKSGKNVNCYKDSLGNETCGQ